MGKAFQPYIHVLRSPTYAVNGQDAISLEGLPTRIFGRIAHLAGFMINAQYTPTFTTAPDVVGVHGLIRNMVFFDGVTERYNASLYDLRQFEILENGRLMNGDFTQPSTNTVVHVRRFLPVGPAKFQGNPTDFLIPCAGLKSGELRLNFGALTDISADTTAIGSVNIIVAAVLVPLDNEVRLPPAFERRTFNFGTTEAMVQGKALYSTVAIGKQANTPFAAGDLGQVSWDSGLGQSPNVEVSTLTSLAQYFLGTTALGQLAGEPRTATDTALRQVNPSTPSALSAAPLSIQSVIQSPDDSRITKLLVDATSALRVRWTGSFATPKMYVARFLENPATAYAAQAARALGTLGLQGKSPRVKTLDKTDYNGPRQLYMPWTIKTNTK